jgi:protein TonB
LVDTHHHEAIVRSVNLQQKEKRKDSKIFFNRSLGGPKRTAMLDHMAFSSTDLLLAVAGVALLLVAIIFIGRVYFAKQTKGDLTKKYADKKWKSPLEARTKYPEVDVFRMSPILMRVAVIAALALTVLAFNWTTYDKKVDIPEDALVIEEDIEIEIPRSAEPPPPPPPPPPPVIQEVPEEALVEVEDDFEFVDQSIDAETSIETPEITADTKSDVPPPPPPPPPPPEPKIKEIFRVVEQMPRFPGCENIQGDDKAKKACADQKLLEFIYQNIKFPAVARENGIQGTVVVNFVVNDDGSVTEVQVLRDIGGGCGDEAKRVVELMNNLPDKWTPGRQRGKAVRVSYTLPVKFRLEYN